MISRMPYVIFLLCRHKKRVLVEEHRLKKVTGGHKPIMPRKADRDRKFTVKRMERHLSALGMDPTAAAGRARSRSVSRVDRGRKRDRSEAPGTAMAMEVEGETRAMKRLKSRSRSRSRPVEALPGEGFKDTAQKVKAIKMGRVAVKVRNLQAKRGEGDRQVFDLRPKHLFSGKRGIGKTDRR